MEKEKKKIKILTPDEAFEKFLNWFDSNKKMAFFVALIVGIISHITMITETIMSQDGLWNSMEYFRPGEWEVSLGRWGIEIIERATQFIAIPTINTIFCILMMAITAVFVVDLLDLKSKTSIVITSLAFVLTPTLVATSSLFSSSGFFSSIILRDFSIASLNTSSKVANDSTSFFFLFTS